MCVCFAKENVRTCAIVVRADKKTDPILHQEISVCETSVDVFNIYVDCETICLVVIYISRFFRVTIIDEARCVEVLDKNFL